MIGLHPSGRVSMEPYPQSSEMEQFFAKLMTAILPMRWQVHPLPEIEAWDTESRSDIKNSDIAYRVCPRAFVQVHPRRREGAGVYLRLHQTERPLVVRGRIDDAYGRVSRNRIEFPSKLQHSLRGYAGFRACVLHCLEQRSGYGITAPPSAVFQTPFEPIGIYHCEFEGNSGRSS